MKRKNRTIVLICLLLSIIMAGCGNKATGTQTAGTGDAKKPFVITCLNTYFSAEPPPSNHEIYKMIEEETGAVFDTTWIPGAAYREKINLAIASDDLPMVLNGKTETRSSTVLDAQRAGVFWELTDKVLSQCSYFLNRLDSKVNNVLKLDGKLYTLYEERPVGRSAIIYRKDWLEKLGLDVPYTMEDYDKAIRAFAARDPDGNGRKDTYGIYATNVAVFDQLRMFAIGYGGVHTWKIDANGAFIHEVQTPEYRKALDLFRDYYKQGILNPDFVALSAVQDTFDAFQAQKSGFMLMAALDDALKQGAVLTLDPKADIAVTAYLTDTNGKNYIAGGNGHSGGFLFGKKAIKDEETLVKVLKVFDKIAEPEGRITNACVWGLEGRHFTIENGKLKQTAEQKELNNLEVMNFVQYRVTFDHRASWDNADVSQLQFDVIDGWKVNESMAVMDPSLPFISDTYVEKGTQLDNARKDAVMKYIMGELDGRGYDVAIQKWLNDGGAAMAKEFEAAYKASQS